MGALAPFGLRFVHVEHEDRSQKSDEEASRLNAVYRELLGQRWVNQRSDTEPITIDDILVVSPYNMQVNLLKQILPIGARVGTVDKFQGQEGAVVLISMAASSGEHIPRGLEFLFSPNRLNVAISRGRCLSTILASPRLLGVTCRSCHKCDWPMSFAGLRRTPSLRAVHPSRRSVPRWSIAQMQNRIQRERRRAECVSIFDDGRVRSQPRGC